MTKYDLACGAVFKKTLSEDHLFKVYREIYMEHNVIHVRTFREVKGSSSIDRLSWETFYTMKDAKTHFNSKKVG